MRKPIIAIPLGDPAGIGPEIVVKSLADEAVLREADCVVIGAKKVIEKAMEMTGTELNIHVIDTPKEGNYQEGTLNLIDLDNISPDDYEMGVISGKCGYASFEFIKKSIELANAHLVDAVATTPINKESLRAGNVNFIGHTEIFGELTGTKDPLTMFEVRNMRVFFLTRHVSLVKACQMLTKERVIDYVIRCTEALKKLGVTEGTMAIAGLNPHSGEHGLFGYEEVNEIFPAVDELKKMGYDVEGPVSADSVFHLALQGNYNSVLSLYHDQGHIATKTLDFEKTIAVTNGLPFLRTSVDHGTAFNIAGKGIASAVSMKEAIHVAAKYALNFNGVTE
jgi:4-hydroxythreonine-4-phosphate dehydrogenase